MTFRVYLLIVEFDEFSLNTFTGFSSCSSGVNIEKKKSMPITKARGKENYINYTLRIYSFSTTTRVRYRVKSPIHSRKLKL